MPFAKINEGGAKNLWGGGKCPDLAEGFWGAQKRMATGADLPREFFVSVGSGILVDNSRAENQPSHSKQLVNPYSVSLGDWQEWIGIAEVADAHGGFVSFSSAQGFVAAHGSMAYPA